MSNLENTITASIANPVQKPGGNNEMAVRKYGDKYEVAIPDGRYANGRIKYKRELADTEEQAYKREQKLLAEIKGIQNRLDSLQTDSEKSDKPFTVAAKEWIKSKKSEVSLKTWKRYKSILKVHVIPFFQNIPVSKISEDDIKSYLQNNPNCGTTLRQHYVIIDHILRQEGLDTMKNIKRPKKNRRAINCIKDPKELAEFVMSFRKKTLLYLPIYIAANTGMRFSEIAGLKWQDVDLYNGYISVNRSLHWDYDENNNRYWYIQEEGKSPSSLRIIKINDGDIEVLKEAKRKQKGKHGDFVCVDTRGNPIAQDTHGNNFRQYTKARGYNINFHSLRHSHATILIMIYKVPIKTVSRRLGHSNITVTLDIYTSVIQEQDDLAAAAMEDVFCEARKDTNTCKKTEEVLQ